MKLGQVLMKERERKKLSSEDVAGKLGIPAEKYQEIEAGNSPAETWGPLLTNIAIKLETPTSRLLAVATAVLMSAVLLPIAVFSLLRVSGDPKPAYDAFTGFTAETTPPVASITGGPSAGSLVNDSTPTFTFVVSP